ncbi:MAG: hypothetical protein ACO294_00465 [Methylococcales bacterium]
MFKTNSVIISLFLLSLPLMALAQPQEAQANAMQACSFLTRIDVSSGYGHYLNWKLKAKINTLARAEKIGATHIVWEHFFTPSSFTGMATAKAYKCP